MLVHGATSDWQVEEPPIMGYSFWESWAAGEWEKDTLDIVSRFVVEDSTFLDIGAWIGPLTLWAADLGARVIAVEPDRTALRYLWRNVEMNADECVAIVEGAIADHSGTCRLAPQKDYGWGSSMSYVSNEGATVECWTLPGFFRRFVGNADVSLVKMDIEGAEAKVLRTAAPFLASRGIPLLVSFHHEFGAVLDKAPAWFAGFSRLEGEFGTTGQLLAIP